MVAIGAHISIAGGLYNCFSRSAQIGGDTLQIFSKSPRGRDLPRYTSEDYAKAREERTKYKQIGGIIHSNYLANLSKPSEECAKDMRSIMHDFEVAHYTGFDAVNVHIGKQKGFETREEAFINMAKNVERILKFVQEKGYTDVQYLFENTAGQGSELGTSIEELGVLSKQYLKDLPVKFCIDTAHCRGAGQDFSDFESFMNEWNDHVGEKKLYSFHLNDAKVPFGAHLDRHAPLGRGLVGFQNLVGVIQYAAKTDRHIYIETTKPELRPEEIQLVHSIAAGKTDRIPEFDKKFFRTEVLKKFQ